MLLVADEIPRKFDEKEEMEIETKEIRKISRP
jgi:hypothetical protein